MDVTLLPSLWIQEVYWRLGLPHSDIDKCPGAESELWDVVSARLGGFISILSSFLHIKKLEKTYDPDIDKKVKEVLWSVLPFGWKTQSRSETVYWIKRLLSCFSDPQLVD